MKGSCRGIIRTELRGKKMLKGLGTAAVYQTMSTRVIPPGYQPGCKDGKLRTGSCIHGASSLELSHPYGRLLLPCDNA